MARLFRKIAPLLQSTTCYGRVSDVISIYDTQTNVQGERSLPLETTTTYDSRSSAEICHSLTANIRNFKQVRMSV